MCQAEQAVLEEGVHADRVYDDGRCKIFWTAVVCRRCDGRIFRFASRARIYYKLSLPMRGRSPPGLRVGWDERSGDAPALLQQQVVRRARVALLDAS